MRKLFHFLLNGVKNTRISAPQKTTPPVFHTIIMQPYSADRIEWVQARLSILNEMKKDMMQRRAWYAQALQASQEVIAHTIMNVRAEELQLQAELNVLHAWSTNRVEGNVNEIAS